MSSTTAPGDGESIFSYNITTDAGGSIFEPLFSIIDNDIINDYANLTEEDNYANKSLIVKLAENLVVHPDKQYLPAQAAVGVGLAVFANCLNGIAIILNKQSLKQLTEGGSVRASAGGFGYLKLPRWWLSMFVISIGEMTSFVAFMFAPAILVAPLGIVAILVAAALSPYFLKEKLGMQGKLGCFLAVVGCLIITVCGPKDHEMTSLDEVEYYLTSPPFITYFTIVVIVASTLMYIAPKYGDKNIMVFIMIICSYGSCAVMFCKGVGLGIMTTIEGDAGISRWSFWACFFALLFCLLIELIYQQRALDAFNSSIVISAGYIVIGSLIMIFSAIIFAEKRNIDWKDTVLTVSGFLVNICALFLLNIDKDPDLKVTKPESTKSDAECPPTIYVTNCSGDNKESVPKHLYELRRNSRVLDYSNISCLTSVSSPLKIPTLNIIGSTKFGEISISNSCVSLISETASSNQSFNKDESSSYATSQCSADENIHDDSRSLDGESEGELSDDSIKSSRSAIRGLRRRLSQEGHSFGTLLARTKLQPCQALPCMLEASRDQPLEDIPSSDTCQKVVVVRNINKPGHVIVED